MYDAIGIYPRLHRERGIRCVSLEGLGIVFQKVIIDFNVVAMSKRRLGTQWLDQSPSRTGGPGFESWFDHFSHFNTK